MGHVGNGVHHVGVRYWSVRDVGHVTHGGEGLVTIGRGRYDSLTHGCGGRLGCHGDCRRRGTPPTTRVDVGLRMNWI